MDGRWVDKLDATQLWILRHGVELGGAGLLLVVGRVLCLSSEAEHFRRLISTVLQPL
jgi:hypothetical protein